MTMARRRMAARTTARQRSGQRTSPRDHRPGTELAPPRVDPDPGRRGHRNPTTCRRPRAVVTPSHEVDSDAIPGHLGCPQTRSARGVTPRRQRPRLERLRWPSEPGLPRVGPNPGTWDRPQRQTKGSTPADERVRAALGVPPRNSGGGDPGSWRANHDRHRRPRTGTPVPVRPWEARVPSSGSSYRPIRSPSESIYPVPGGLLTGPHGTFPPWAFDSPAVPPGHSVLHRDGRFEFAKESHADVP